MSIIVKKVNICQKDTAFGTHDGKLNGNFDNLRRGSVGYKVFNIAAT